MSLIRNGLAGLLMLQLGCAGNAPTLIWTPTAALSAPTASTGAPDLSSNDYKLGGDRSGLGFWREQSLGGI